ncbi:hypothetical protein ACIO3O_02240 [Streptomyces sp. NPDC087440]|uniref:hypothetical protein n=1 Tax=Streptomyces sp. NPDC087440 TaxID=3365790 RepID=UPI0038181A0D
MGRFPAQFVEYGDGAQFARAELQARAAPTGRAAAQAAYVARAATSGPHPHLRAALSGSVEPDPSTLFEQTTHRLLTGLLTPGSHDSLAPTAPA